MRTFVLILASGYCLLRWFIPDVGKPHDDNDETFLDIYFGD